MQIFAIVVSLAIAVVGIALFVRAIREILGVIRIGQPAGRTDQPATRTVTMLKETLGHTRMLQWTLVGAAHWFVFVGFGLLFFTLLTAFGQLFDAHFAIPLIGHFFLYEWATEFFTVVMVLAILGFIGYRLSRPRERARGVKGRFFGSTMWQGYFVELVILGVGLCILALRGLEYALFSQTPGDAELASAFHFPFTFWLGEAFSGLSVGTIETLIYLVAMLKIVISFTWMITISLNTTMGVAWHRFSAFFNIWFRREADGRNALGEMKPLTSRGETVSLDDIEELDEDATLGVGSIEDFSWKGILDFTTCTECGRCQSQCPAWNTEKPLSPKLLVMGLRDHAYAKAPYLQADSEESRAELPAAALKEAERPLVGDTGDDWFYMPENGSAVIDPDVLWSCTSCGACVQQCPVDIEHVDHIMDMRRYQVLVEANFPAELNQLFKGLENKGNPWNMSASARMDWAKDLPFDVKVVGEDIESLDDVDWLFWVGCAGAYEDRAKKTTRAVAELLDMAGVSFGVLGNGETCNGDPARRAGNEFVFQGLATQNAETFKEYKVKKVVSTCAHCFNTLKNEYKDFGVELEVVHHTQLLNRLVREGKLTPVTEGAGAAKRSITYHDPCYIGRHNGVYTPPRELLQILPGAEVVEMERNSERSFCCGAGGARMWMEENIGERINVNRTKEAVGTGADQIAVGCPFCRVMLSDGLTAEQANGNAREEVEVLDVAQMLLASVKGESATKLAPGSGTNGASPAAKKSAAADEADGATGGAAAAGAGTTTQDAATKAEPSADDVTQTDETVTDTEDVGPAAKASGGSSLFDTPAESETATEEKSVPEEAEAAKPESSGGSLFDLGGDDESSAAEAKAAPSADEPKAAPDEAAAAAETADDPAATSSEAEETESGPAAEGEELGAGGSLFDIGGADGTTTDEAPARAAETAAASPAEEATAEASDDAGDADSTDEPADGAEPEADAAAEPVAAEPEADAAAEPVAAEPEAEAADSSDEDGSFSGGSLFDIKAKHEAKAAESTENTESAGTTSEQSDEAVSAEAPTEAVSTDESADEPDPKGTEAEAAESAEDAVESATTSAGEPEESATAAASGAAVTPASEIPEEGSLFDIEAPAEAAPAAEAPTPEPSEPSDESVESPAGDDAAESADGAAESEQPEASPEAPVEDQPSAEAAEVEPSTDDATAEPGDSDDAASEPTDSDGAEQSTDGSADEDPEPAAEDPAAEPAESKSSTDEPAKERPASSGEAHTPKTDVEINDSGSLFDL